MKKRGDKSLMAIYVCLGAGGFRAPKSHNDPYIAYLPLTLTSAAATATAAAALRPTLGARLGTCLSPHPSDSEEGLASVQKASSATDAPTRSWAFFPLFLSVSPASSAA